MRIHPVRGAAFLAITVGFLLAGPAWAQWVPGGGPIATAPNDQLTPQAISDGAGGSILVWMDARSAPYAFDLYAQRVDATGTTLWAANGVAITTAPGDQVAPSIVSDGAGGVIVAWQDERDSLADIYVQRVDAAGVVRWAAEGVPLCTAPDDQLLPRVTSDGAGGAIAIWEDYRFIESRIYASRVNAAGVPLWGANGVAVCSAPEFRFDPDIASDGLGGAIAIWFDARGDDFDIYVQRLSPEGASLWTADGVKICGALNSQEDAVIASDGQGGAVLAWVDYRDDGFHSDLYAQRVGPTGAALWTVDGVALCTSPDDQFSPVVARDGLGGMIVAWEDTWSDEHDIYGQRVDASGAVRWTAQGHAFCTLPGDQGRPAIANVDPGEALVVWQDYRSSNFNADIYAQHVDSTGVEQWANQGEAVTTAGGDQTTVSVILDGAGGAILAWEDARSGTSSDIYAQQLFTGGTVAVPVPSPGAFRVTPPMPNPSRARTEFSFRLPASERVAIEILDIEGRSVRTLGRREFLPAGSHTRAWDGRDDSGALVRVGLYLVRVRTGNGVGVAKVSILR